MEIHYFQRYHDKENVDTANAMLLLSRLYEYSADKFYEFLETYVLPDKFDPEVKFVLQEKDEKSVPDATISQRSFKIVIETKLYNNFSENQLKNHLAAFKKDAFDKADYKILLTLDPNNMDVSFKENFDNILKEYNKNEMINKSPIYHTHLTFRELCAAVKDTIGDKDDEMLEVVTDYENYCNDSGLIPDDHKKMRAELAGTTFAFNRDNGIYYNNSDRSWKHYEYIGLYTQKSVRALGRITTIVTADQAADGTLTHHTDRGTWEPGMEKLIISTMQDADKYGYNIRQGHRFFIVDKFYDTDFRKTSPRAPLGFRMFNLADILEQDSLPVTSEIAKLLRNKSWV